MPLPVQPRTGVGARTTATRGPSSATAAVLPTPTVTVVSQLANRKACHCRLSLRPSVRRLLGDAVLLAESEAVNCMGMEGTGHGPGPSVAVERRTVTQLSARRLGAERPPQEWGRAVRVKPDWTLSPVCRTRGYVGR